MRIAALYDIHGNIAALEAVLAEVEAAGIDRVIIGGDVVPGPFPGACYAALARLDAPVTRIRGNGDHDTLRVLNGETPARIPENVVDALRWVAARVPRELESIGELPLTERVPGLPWGPLLFCHATPRDDSEIFTARTPEDRLRPVFDPVDAAAVVCGHTHMQFDRRVGDVRVVNAGSVGMPFGEPGAYWALIGDDGIELRRTAYDVAAAQRRIDASGYPLPFPVRVPTPAEQMVEKFEEAAIGGAG
jgi:predicted phosphodiesterase